MELPKHNTGRDRTLAEFQAKLNVVVRSGRPDAVVDAELSALAAKLADLASPAVDPEVRTALGCWHCLRYLAEHDIEVDFESAVRLMAPLTAADWSWIMSFRRAAETHGKSANLGNLGLVLEEIFQHTGDLQALETAANLARDAVRLLPPEHPGRVGYLSNLCLVLDTLFEQTGEMAVLHEAVKVGRESVGAADPAHPDYLSALNCLGISLRTLYQRTSDISALQEAVEISRAALASASADDPEHAIYVSNHGGSLRLLFAHSGDLGALEEAVEMIRNASITTPPDHPQMAMYRSNLSNALYTLYEQRGELTLLEEAVQAGRDAVNATAVSSPERASYANNLSTALRGLFARTGDVEDLQEAAEMARAAATASLPDHVGRAGYLSNASAMLQGLFEQTGDEAALKEAVQLGRAAVTATPHDHPKRAMFMSNLGATLLTAFKRFGDLEHLQAAVDIGRSVLAATPLDHPYRDRRQSNFAAILSTLFDRTGNIDLLKEAAEAGRSALAAVAVDHPERTGRLTSLGIILRNLSEEMDDPKALEEAVCVQREAVAATPAGHEAHAMHLSNLVLSLRTLFERTEAVELLRESIQLGSAAVSHTPPDNPSLALYLTNLGGAQWSLFNRTADAAALAEARKCFAKAAGLMSAAVDVRAAAARYAADADLAAGDHVHALAMAELAVELLALVAPRRLRRGDRQHRVVSLHGIATTVATAAIAAGRPERAVEMLEQTRGFLIADTLDMRGDLYGLRHRAPELANEVEALWTAVDEADQDSEGPRRDHSQLLEQWDELLSRIRSVSGFPDFLRPALVSRLRHAAVNGPIVYVIVHDHASHALVLRDDREDPVETVLLTDLTEAAVHDQVDLLRTAQEAVADGDHSRVAQQQIQGVLHWLWSAIARPVLDHLAYIGTPPQGQQWPRMWWCPVGITTFLPLHAAGDHEGRVDTVMDRVISSYTPTVRSLLRASAAPRSTAGRTVVIAVPDAPDVSPLPGAAAEATRLVHLIPGATVLPTPGGATTRGDVLTALSAHEVAHFACHGFADLTDPANSRLVLHDHGIQPLSVSTIAQLRLDHGELAFLSACNTSDTDPRHADEATHLTAAFHLAGYRSVIGTLWPVIDQSATFICRHVYAYLTNDGTDTPQPAQAAQALHQVVRRRRDMRPHVPTQWAAYVHTGL